MPSPIRLGVIGTDSSHLAEFARRMRSLHDVGKTRCLITHFWTDGSAQGVPAEQVAAWEAGATEVGARRVGTRGEVLDQCDGVLVLALDGERHFDLALPAVERGLATFIDRPLTCNLAQARELQRLVRKANARCFSASSLRFTREVAELPRKALGDIVAVDATGPAQMESSMSGLFAYGVHTVEMLDALMGRGGVRRIRAVSRETRELIDLEYRDGRTAHLRLERAGSYGFAALVHGTDGLHALQVNFAGAYDRFVEALTRYFEGGTPPVELRDTVETIAVMESANASLRGGGTWVEVPPVE